jgi:hypothetical protein
MEMPETTATEDLAVSNSRAVKVDVRVEVAGAGERSKLGTVDERTYEEGGGDNDTGSKSGGLAVHAGSVKVAPEEKNGVGVAVVVVINEAPEADQDTGSKSGDRGVGKRR